MEADTAPADLSRMPGPLHSAYAMQKKKAFQTIKPSILTAATVYPLFLFEVSPVWVVGTATEMQDKRKGVWA